MKPKLKFVNICKSLSNLTSLSNNAILKSIDTINGPRPLPLIGNVWRYLPIVGCYKPDTLYENALYNKKHYGSIVREKITSKLIMLHLFDPKDIELFFHQDCKFPHRRSHRALLKYRVDRPEQYHDGGLFPENGGNWYRQRAQFQQRMLSKSQLASNVTKMDETSLNVVAYLNSLIENQSENTIPNFESIIFRWAFANSLRLFMNLDIDLIESRTVSQLMKELNDTLEAIDGTELKSDRWNSKPQSCPYYRKLVQSQDTLYEFVEKHVNSCTSNDKTSYLYNWLFVDKLDRRDIISFVMDSLIAGLHTTSYTLLFLTYYISSNKPILELVRKELTRILTKDSISINQIDSLSFLRDCLKETMRLSPVSIGTGRLTSRELTLRGCLIPEGIMVIMQNQVISRDEDIFFECDTFKPQRWAGYRSQPRSKRPSPFATLPFGFGARACIGQRLAEAQIKIMAARLLQKFDITFDGPIKTKTTLIHNIDGPVSISLSKIKTC